MVNRYASFCHNPDDPPPADQEDVLIGIAQSGEDGWQKPLADWRSQLNIEPATVDVPSQKTHQTEVSNLGSLI